MWSGFQDKKLNTRRERELAANQAKPENQAGPVPGPDHDQKENFKKNIWNFIFGEGQGQVQAQPGFQAQPGLQQVQVQILRRHSTFWPENHFTW